MPTSEADMFSQLITMLSSQGGVITLLVLILVGGARRWWTWGWLYEEMKQERDTWRELALEGTQMAEQAVGTIAEVAASSNLAPNSRRKRPPVGKQ